MVQHDWSDAEGAAPDRGDIAPAMRELLEIVLAITMALLGATATIAGLTLIFCSLSFGTCWYVIRRIRRARRDG